MLLAGNTVISNVSGVRGTVVAPPLAHGKVRVRFDGMREAVEIDESRVRRYEVQVASDTDGEDPRYFKKGDYVQLTDKDGRVIKGAPLDDFSRHTLAVVDFLTDDGRYLEVNTNYYEIEVLFRADIARGDTPKF